MVSDGFELSYRRYRLVMPPVMGFAIAAILYLPFRSMFEPCVGLAGFHVMLAGGFVGYMLYDLFHYASHHASWVRKVPHLRFMKRYHMKHHWSGNQNLGYGITTTIWDRVFGTTLNVQPLKTKHT